MKKFAVIGSPISHSLSPSIHGLFGKLCGIELSYEAIEVDRSSFTEKVMELFKDGYDGINVTLPLKNLAYEVSDHPSNASLKSTSANVIWRQEGKIHSDNTDGEGLVSDLEEKELFIENKKLLMIGAGGSAISILPSLIDRKPKEIKIINRTYSRAIELVEKFKREDVKLSAGNLLDPLSFKAEAIINTTSAGLLKEEISLPAGTFANQDWTYDLSYSNSETLFSSLARRHGIKKTHDGFGMLMQQAALSFEIWTGNKPDIKMATKLLTPNS